MMMTLSDGDHGSPVGPVPVGDLQPAEAAGHPALGRHGPPRPELHLSAAALHTGLTTVLFLDQGNLFMEFYCVAGLDWTYFDVQCGIGGLHVGQVCLCHPGLISHRSQCYGRIFLC